MRSLIKIGALALTTVVASAAFIGCSSDSKKSTDPVGSTDKNSGPVGGIGLDLQPVPGITISHVLYSVTGGTGPGGAIPTINGDLPTPGTASNFSFGVPLPVATGYQLSLTAESDEAGDNITCTGGFGPFAITPNSVTNITLTLTCVDNTSGQVVGKVNVATDACPTLKVNYAVATPHTANVGSSIQVLSLAADTNAALPITYAWSVASPIGNFASATSKDTTFNCTAGGADVLITVTANNSACSKKLSTVISCANVTCGDTVFDPAVEPCDNSGPPATDNPLCLPNCTLAVCGNGGPPETPVEQCEPPNTATCNGTCQTRTPNCGDGFVTPPEQCEPPNTATCSATCTNIGAVVCGDGVVGAGETCDVPGGNNYSVENCGDIWDTEAPVSTPPGGSADDCNPISSAACQTCTDANCAGAENCSGGPNPPLCNEVLDCVRDTGCADGGFVLSCYCGSVTTQECDAGLGTGACRAEIEAGEGSTDPAFVQLNILNAANATGRAMQRVDCELASGCTACL